MFYEVRPIGILVGCEGVSGFFAAEILTATNYG
jgi:hypothetical protein